MKQISNILLVPLFVLLNNQQTVSKYFEKTTAEEFSVHTQQSLKEEALVALKVTASDSAQTQRITEETIVYIQPKTLDTETITTPDNMELSETLVETSANPITKTTSLVISEAVIPATLLYSPYSHSDTSFETNATESTRFLLPSKTVEHIDLTTFGAISHQQQTATPIVDTTQTEASEELTSERIIALQKLFVDARLRVGYIKEGSMVLQEACKTQCSGADFDTSTYQTLYENKNAYDDLEYAEKLIQLFVYNFDEYKYDSDTGFLSLSNLFANLSLSDNSSHLFNFAPMHFLMHLAQMKKLKYLDLRGFIPKAHEKDKYGDQNATDLSPEERDQAFYTEFYNNLSQLPKLQYINISDTSISLARTVESMRYHHKQIILISNQTCLPKLTLDTALVECDTNSLLEYCESILKSSINMMQRFVSGWTTEDDEPIPSQIEAQLEKCKDKLSATERHLAEMKKCGFAPILDIFHSQGLAPETIYNTKQAASELPR